jgi:uncharacterized membrane protein
MQNQINFASLTVAILGALKLILQVYGLEITDDHINAIANGVAALVAVVGVLMSHRKPITKEATADDSTISTPVESAE